MNMPQDGDRPGEAASRMLQLLNACFTVQALHVVAALGIADRLAEGPATVDDLAAATGAHQPHEVDRDRCRHQADGAIVNDESHHLGVQAGAQAAGQGGTEIGSHRRREVRGRQAGDAFTVEEGHRGR